MGNTIVADVNRDAPAVHPHACGEHVSMMSALVGKNGSSPRLWGTLLEIRAGRVKNRFIPTPVGNTAPPADRS
ncbi:hypothetical protein D1AOALGA4SA_11468 [Olavius algarvensis Delta 1 endosymbiont]|nr:hypothetical protein D1AOALGA4SA_11468 [Olavius algarvensis Delta 1 endosymbiont]